MTMRHPCSILVLGLALYPGCVFDPSGFGAPDSGGDNGNNNTNANGNNGNTNVVCGDGLVTGTEECDDENVYDFDGCDGTCRIEHGYECTGEPSDCHAQCGDGLLAGGIEAEGCDDGNADPGDGCDATCQLEDGWACPAEGSACIPICGDGLVVGSEECDDGAANSDTVADACRLSCLHARCGDGVIDTNELCDGANFGAASCGDYTPADAGDLLCESACTVVNASGCYESCSGHTDCTLGQQCLANRCESVGNTCDDDPVVITGSGLIQGTTENLTHNFCADSDCNGVGTHTHGGDRFYELTLNQGEYLIAWLDPHGGADGALGLVTDCIDFETYVCSHAWNRANEPGARERIDYVSPTNNNTVYLVVDADQDAPSEGDFTLDIEIGGPTADVAAAGDILFSELMPLAAGNANNCEWFEIFNPTATARNLFDLDFLGGATLYIGQPLVVPAGESLLLARNAEPGTNCGLDWVAWPYGADYIRNDATNDMLIRQHTTNQDIDEVIYTNSTWPYGDGVSMYLCTNHLTAAENDNVAFWQTDTTNGYGTEANFGTPGAANPGPCN